MPDLKQFLAAAALLTLVGLGRGDELDNVRDRMKVEAERVEKEFADQRLAAYKLVRRDDPKLSDATEKLKALLTAIRADTSLDGSRREVLIVTLKADLDRVRLIASDRERLTLRGEETMASRAIVIDSRSTSEAARSSAVRRVTDDSRSIIEMRSRAVADARGDRKLANERYAKVMRSVEESAIPEARDMTFPKNWVELSKRRTGGAKLTAMERAIMKALGSTISVEFEKNTLEEVMGYLKKATGVEILLDKRALQEASVTYDTPVTLRSKMSMRTILKRILSDLNLTYVIKDEAIQVTSRERAKELTTTRAYYIGDLVTIVDYTMPYSLSQLAMVEQVNRLITMITKNVDEQSWKVNNPDSVGTIVFDPITMSIVVKQTAEVHHMLGGFR